MKGYNESQTRALIEQAIKGQENGISLSKVFEDYARQCGKARGSIRNYYYFLVKQAKEGGTILELYPDLAKLTSIKNVGFTKSEEQSLLDAVNEGVMQGKSIRRVINELSCGDAKLALRYQNKYRNLRKNLSPKKCFGGDKLLSELSGKINSLVDKIGQSLREENLKLARKNEELVAENKRLKKQISMGLIEKYFEKNLDDKFIRRK